jgi:hypothetical protein
MRLSRDAIRLWRASRAATRGKEKTPLNNNRGNNRRRGRGGNRQQGGQQLNRIDSRARGNAPQMLEKYRKLAHDAHLNGDRVTAEFYLQFADHYFRVIADTRLRQEEQRARREDGGQDRQDNERDENDDSEFSADNDFPSYDQPRQSPRQRDDRGDRGERQDRRRQSERAERDSAEADQEKSAEAVADNPYEPPENPFVKPARTSGRGLRPRRARQAEGEAAAEGDASEPGLDPASLPPSISREAEAEKPAPRRRGRPRSKPADDGDSETMASVG